MPPYCTTVPHAHGLKHLHVHAIPVDRLVELLARVAADEVATEIEAGQRLVVQQEAAEHPERGKVDQAHRRKREKLEASKRVAEEARGIVESKEARARGKDAQRKRMINAN